jgi:hypothetical protein
MKLFFKIALEAGDEQLFVSASLPPYLTGLASPRIVRRG